MMVPILGGGLRNGIGSVLSGRMLWMTIYPRELFAARVMVPALGRAPGPASSKAFVEP